MDSDKILPVIAASSVVLLIIGKLYYKVRIRFPIKVNCWFCNSNSSVPFNSSNSWYCPQCNQYNGFSSDGGYNRLLVEQYNEKLNNGAWCAKDTRKRPSPHNGLCRFCNINLELKIQQLAQFVPLNKDCYDEEVQQYSNQLERVYHLCSRCQVVLDKTLKAKQEMFVTSQNHSFKSLADNVLQPQEKEKHSVCVGLTTVVSLGLMLSVIPQHWMTHLLTTYPPPDYILQLLSLVQHQLPDGFQLSVAFLVMGMLVQLCDFLHMRDVTSFVNFLLWTILLLLTHIPVQVDGLTSVIHMLAGVVFFITSVMDHKSDKPKSIAAVKPVQFHKLDRKSETNNGNTSFEKKKQETSSKPKLDIDNKSLVSEPSPIRPVTPSYLEPTPEDFGFSKLNVSSRRLTRSQTKHFQTTLFGSKTQNYLFQPKPVTLSPPKLLSDKASEFQVPITRSSSQSSGYISLAQQKDFEEYRSPSVAADDFESISHCGGRALTQYQSSFVQPPLFSPPFGMPLSHFQPLTVMHYGVPPFNKFYQYTNLTPYEHSLNLSTFTVNNDSSREGGWFQTLKSSLHHILFLFLIASNVAVLWKVFGEEYFKSKT